MTSQIDPTLPVTGTPTTASVRANFQTAHDEITAIQDAPATGTGTKVLQTSPTIITPSLVGVVSGTNAPTGNVGEVLFNTGAATPLTTGAFAALLGVPLTAGDWDIYFQVTIAPSAGVVAGVSINISSSAGSIFPGVSTDLNVASGFLGQVKLPGPPSRLLLSVTATVTINAVAVFASGTCTGTGVLWARRAR
jgi:hypothetical protein